MNLLQETNNIFYKLISRIFGVGSIFNLNQTECIHRLGKVEISGCAVVVVTGAGYRKEAYDANRYIIDKVKNEVPIWKHEFFADGTSEWGLNCDCETNEHEHRHHHEKAE